MDYLLPFSGSLPPSSSLQDALSSWGATLFTNGCNQTDGAANCTAACQNSSQAFHTLETLHNCVLYIGVADAYASQDLSSNDTQLADDLVIQKSDLGSPVSQNVNSTITACFDAYCNGSTACTGLMSSAKWGGTPPDTFNYSTSFNLDGVNFNPYDFSIRIQADDLCGYIVRPSPLNPDIGGIGVYASYWIQSGLALLGTFLVLLWGWGTRYICLPSMAGRRGNNATKPAKGILVTFEKRRLASLTAVLTDFQKAQCFFMLAVNIAALANKANGGLSPVSLPQLYDNESLLASVAVSGTLPITATLLALHMVDMISGYLLALSGCTVALSIATVAAIGNFEPSRGDLQSIRAQSRNGTYPECGNLDLSVFCLLYQDNDPSSTYVWGIMAYCLLVLFYIFAYHLQRRPWVLCMVSCMSSTRTLQFVVVPLGLVFNRDSSILILGSLTLAYLAILPFRRLRCARKINSTGFISFRCGLDLLAWVSWLAAFAFIWNPFTFLIWVTFTITTVQLLRKAYVEDTKIRKWALKYPQFAYGDETLPMSSLGNHSIRTHLRTSSTIIMKASVTLVTLISMLIDKLENGAASHDWPGKCRRFLVICLYWMLFLGCIVSFVFVFQGLASFWAKVDTTSWTFGQIVALTVWAPPLCEYFHLELRGMTRGFQHRLLPPYKVLATVTTAHPGP